MPTLAERLATYAANLTYDAIPEKTRHEAKRRVIDSLACALGAFTAEPPKIARALARELGGHPSATVFGTSLRTAPDLATFANGLAIRYLDYNDTYLSLEPAHPSDNIAAALAVAESEGRDGRALIEAIVLGYEIQCRLCDAASIRSRGWDHVTYGALSSALLAGKLMSLSVPALVHTLGLAATPNVALRQTRAGELSMWKGAAFANAARNGVFAALLAKHGMTGPAPIFEGVMGFMKQVSGPFELPALGGENDDFMIDRTYIKHFPAEYHSQAAIELILQMRAQHGLRHEEVEAIRVHTFKAAVEIIGGEPEKWRPKSRETADHSMPYCVAAALIDGTITQAQFAPERIADPYIQAYLDRITVVEDPELTAKYPDGIPTRIEVVLKDGRVIAEREDYALGHPNNPMPDAMVEQKFRELAAPLLTERQQERLLDALWHLEEVKDLSAVLAQAVV